ncbi:MAG: dTDP-4-dehydrorhamnose 3,5-epimerase [Flavobacteriales bacterium]|nr:dTDP-4-dehydrorhamnose 3,5-epimerase [Flavobacteriales bacterium]|tara:strand:- start:42 stop:584 length:543 start_codon:yes stop_codon:yes gene_type:complete
MEILETGFKGLLIIKPKVFKDDRGFFFESYNREKMKEIGFDETFVQDNLSKSQKGVLRGMHFQKPPYAQGKLIQVIKGAVLDVVVDIRKNSETYGQHFSIEIDDKDKNQLYVPEGFAHGFLTLEDNTIFSYKCTNNYNKEAEGALMWNDPDLNISWPIENPIISEKDQVADAFSGFVSPF